MDLRIRLSVTLMFPLALVWFIHPLTFAATSQELADELWSKVAVRQPYEFGTEIEFNLAFDEVALLTCSQNDEGVEKVLVYPRLQNKALYICCVMGGGRLVGTNRGAGISAPVGGAFRQFAHAAAIARWQVEGQTLYLRFQLTNDREAIKRGYRRLEKAGRFAQSNINWKALVGDEDFPIPRLSGAERVAAFARLWSEVKHNFANFDLVPALNWDQVLEEYLPRVMRDQSNEEFSYLLKECVALLKDGHTAVSGPTGSSPATAALRVGPVENRAIILEIGNTEEVAQSGLKPGDEITHVDGRSVREILETDIYPYVFASTSQSRDVKAYPRILDGPEGSKARLRVRDLGKSEREVILIRMSDAASTVPTRRLPSVEYREMGDDIAYVAINTFGMRGVVKEFRQHFDKVQQAKGLIIDVRKNGGGNSAHGDAVIGYLIAEPIQGERWKTRQYRPAFRAWGRDEEWHEGAVPLIKPRVERPFLGPIVILIGPETFSAAEDFVVPLHASGRATVVGQRSAGSTGQPLHFGFAGGIRGRICTKRNTYPDGREFIGVGIIPDVEVRPSQVDIAAGRDAVLEKGLEVLRELKSST